MKIIKKIIEKHNKLIQKLDRPFFINMLIHMFPWVAFGIPFMFGVTAASGMLDYPEYKGVSFILKMFMFSTMLSFLGLQDITNVEKNMKDCIVMIMFNTILSYGTFFAVFFYHLLFH